MRERITIILVLAATLLYSYVNMPKFVYVYRTLRTASESIKLAESDIIKIEIDNSIEHIDKTFYTHALLSSSGKPIVFMDVQSIPELSSSEIRIDGKLHTPEFLSPDYAQIDTSEATIYLISHNYLATLITRMKGENTQ